MTYEGMQVVRAPFPFNDRVASDNRPALVLSDAATFNTPSGHLVLAMITSAKNAPWPLDCPTEDLESAGLPAPSVVRCKLFTPRRPAHTRCPGPIERQGRRTRRPGSISPLRVPLMIPIKTAPGRRFGKASARPAH